MVTFQTLIKNTYVNDVLGHFSCIEHFFVTNASLLNSLSLILVLTIVITNLFVVSLISHAILI